MNKERFREIMREEKFTKEFSEEMWAGEVGVAIRSGEQPDEHYEARTRATCQTLYPLALAVGVATDTDNDWE